MTRAADSASRDRLLVEAAQADPRQFAGVYEQHFDRVYAYVTKRVRDRSLAQDITSDVFHHALANLKRYEWRGIPFTAWLFRIASNMIFDHRQRLAQEQKLPAADGTEPEIDYDDIEQRARLFAAVRALPDDQRRVIQLRFVEQRSIRETSEAMQRSEGAVKQLQLRALDALRAHFREVENG